MKTNYAITELETWDKKIKEIVDRVGLDYYPQEFLICNEQDMIGFMAYSGMPSHYPHWSFGKLYEQTKTMYDYGIQGLPYELVINSDPCLAYLMANNTLLLQVLTIAHVYGHNDFFKNNHTFAKTNAKDTLARFKRHADQIRHYTESYGADAVEKILDAAHALKFHANQNVHIVAEDALQNNTTSSGSLKHENMLLYIRDNAHELNEWQRNILSIVHEEMQYFIPQVQTKILNEGWASFWHYTILNELHLPPDMQMEFLVRHNQVLSPYEGGLNPYHLGFTILRDIEKRYGREKLFDVRFTERDQSFIRNYLTEDLVRELNLFEYQQLNAYNYKVTEVGDDTGWKKIRNTLIKNVGFGGVPILNVIDGNYENKGILLIEHVYDGRELDLKYAREAVKHLYALWGRPVMIKTIIKGHEDTITYTGK